MQSQKDGAICSSSEPKGLLGSEKERKVGDGTLGGGGRRVADGVGRPVLVSAVAFFLAAGADGTGERQQRTSRTEVTNGSGMSRASRSSGHGSDAAAAAAAASVGRTGSMEMQTIPRRRRRTDGVEPPEPLVRLIPTQRT